MALLQAIDLQSRSGLWLRRVPLLWKSVMVITGGSPPGAAVEATDAVNLRQVFRYRCFVAALIRIGGSQLAGIAPSANAALAGLEARIRRPYPLLGARRAGRPSTSGGDGALLKTVPPGSLPGEVYRAPGRCCPLAGTAANRIRTWRLQPELLSTSASADFTIDQASGWRLAHQAGCAGSPDQQDRQAP